MMKKKIYEVPSLAVTEIETKDVVTVSGLIGDNLLAGDKALGYGKIEWIEIDFN